MILLNAVTSTKARVAAAIGLMAALTAIGAFIRIPLPYVPITLQLVVVCIAGGYLGARHGAASQAVYIAAGLIGFPVFAKGGGPQYVLEPSFGYLMGFVPAAFFIGRFRGTEPSFRRILGAMLVGVAVVYAVGVSYLWLIMRVYLNSPLSTSALLQLGMVPLPKDACLCLPAAYATLRLRRSYPV